MLSKLKQLLLSITFNLSLFFILIIGIQNSANKKTVNLIFNETVKLPVSFIIGFSFISGSLAGSFLTINFKDRKE